MDANEKKITALGESCSGHCLVSRFRRGKGLERACLYSRLSGYAVDDSTPNRQYSELWPKIIRTAGRLESLLQADLCCGIEQHTQHDEGDGFQIGAHGASSSSGAWARNQPAKRT